MKFGGSGARPETAAGERVYVIGDVHGRYDLLRALLSRIEAHHAALPRRCRLRLIQLGDLIDRGPDSAKTLRFMSAIAQRTTNLTVLLGNHEAMMLGILAGAHHVMRHWVQGAGGDATLTSYGIDPTLALDRPEAAARLLADAVTPSVVQWLRGLSLTARSGGYLFCHAGIRPGIPIRRQASADLLWIRGEFLDHTGDHGAIVVHGHSVTARVDIRPNRIGIDTEAYASGRLSALYLEGTDRAVIDVEGLPCDRATTEPFFGAPLRDRV